MKYCRNIKECMEYKIEGFCEGWKKPLSELQIRSMLINSTYNVVVINENMIVGIITALSDNINWAFIPYLEVLEKYRENGIGKELMIKMLDELRTINCIDLTCDRELQGFYERFGMLKSEGMVIRRYLNEENNKY